MSLGINGTSSDIALILQDCQWYCISLWCNMQHIFSCLQNNSAHEYDNAMTWEHILHYWPFVWGIHQSPNSQRGSDAGLIFSVLLAGICSLTNIPVACDLRYHGTHVVSLYCYFVGQGRLWYNTCNSVIWYMQFNHLLLYYAKKPLIWFLSDIVLSWFLSFAIWLLHLVQSMLPVKLNFMDKRLYAGVNFNVQKHCGSHCWQYYHWVVQPGN